jgi:hypothetical protein
MKMTLVGIGVIGILFSPVSFGICLGILEDKSWCEYKEKFEKDFDVCKQLSWRRCAKFKKSNPIGYDNCIGRERVSCMRSLGNHCEDADMGRFSKYDC